MEVKHTYYLVSSYSERFGLEEYGEYRTAVEAWRAADELLKAAKNHDSWESAKRKYTVTKETRVL